MTNKRTPTEKESKGLGSRLRKVFHIGSHSRSNSPMPDVALTAPPADPSTPVVAVPLPVAASSAAPLPPADPVPTESMITVDPEEAAKLRAKYTHFRILVIGRAGIGKTTLLQRVCNTKEDPVYSKIKPTSKRGIHNVEDEFCFQSNPEFIFHDSPGFEAGGVEELKAVMSFIERKAKAKNVQDQIHAIWFCFAPDVSRPLLELEERFFNEQHGRNVPVVAIFMQFDNFITKVYDRNKDDEENIQVAIATLEARFKKPLRGYKFPPHAYVQFESMDDDAGNHQEQVKKLIKETAASIDNLALKMLFITVQQNNLEVCITYAVNQNIFGYTRTMVSLIYGAASWFGHCYRMYYDYGKEKERREIAIQEIIERRRRLPREEEALGHFINGVMPAVNDSFEKPSIIVSIATIICLENSFWQVQQGSTAIQGFIKALDIYLKGYHAQVEQKLKNYFELKGSNDWFTMGFEPSEEECANLSKIVLDSLLSHPGISI